MSALVEALPDRLAAPGRLAAATLVDRSGSSPLDPGATMLIGEAGEVEGSVTGGCVEGALVEEARRMFAGAPPRVLSYGVSDELAGEVGLMCGGTVHIFLAEVDGEDRVALERGLRAAAEGVPVAIATVLDGPTAGARMAVFEHHAVGRLRNVPLLDRSVVGDARGLVDQGDSRIRRYASDGARLGADIRVHIQTHAPRPRLVIFGAIDFSAALARIAEPAGYDVTICDVRAPFAASPRFSDHAEVVVSWPDAYLSEHRLGLRDAVVVMTHDAKFDEPALLGALAGDPGYIGALGSRKTQADRARRLRAAGIGEVDLARIAAPCGLDIGARTPTETAVSILGEIIAVRADRAGGRLVATDGSIHSLPQVAVA